MAVNKRDFEAIAYNIASIEKDYPGCSVEMFRGVLVSRLSHYFEGENLNFDPEKFRNDCYGQ